MKDVDVKEIARMQSLIDGYEAYIMALAFMVSHGEKVDYPLFTKTELEKLMNKVWNFVNEAKGIA